MATDAETALVQENIEEYVNDENKIVTCRWLSLTLNLNINVAKRALYTFVEHERNKGGNDDINVTYFVAGLGKTKSGANEHKCVVVPESDLEAVKKSLSVVTSCHIYSVQRAKLKDYTPLYMTDFDVIKNNLDKCSSNSSIKCPWVAIKTGKQPARVSQKQAEDIKGKEPPKTSNSSTPSSSTAKSSTSKKPEPKGSIASMFATANKKGGGDGTGRSAKEPAKSEKKDTSPSKTKQNEKKGKGMLAFIGSGSATNKKATENTSNKGAKSSDRVPDKEKHIPTAKTEVVEDDEPGGKRRKRIRTDLFDSSDDEDDDVVEAEEENVLEEAMMEEQQSPAQLQPDDNEDDEEDKKDDSPAKSPKKEVSPEKHVNGNGRKRKRAMKVVSKQYLDEDGFMVTKKETEWVSGSDDSDVEDKTAPEPEKKVANTEPAKPANKAAGKTESKGKAAPKKAVVSPQKGKQTSLMSFFKKK